MTSFECFDGPRIASGITFVTEDFCEPDSRPTKYQNWVYFLKFGRTGVGPVHGLKFPLVTKSSPRVHCFPSEGRDCGCRWLGTAGQGTGARKRGALLNECGVSHARSSTQDPNVLRRRSQVGFTTKLSTLYLDVCEAKRPTQVFPAEKWATNTLQCRRYFQEDVDSSQRLWCLPHTGRSLRSFGDFPGRHGAPMRHWKAIRRKGSHGRVVLRGTKNRTQDNEHTHTPHIQRMRFPIPVRLLAVLFCSAIRRALAQHFGLPSEKNLELRI